jgi:hypothetical protein
VNRANTACVAISTASAAVVQKLKVRLHAPGDIVHVVRGFFIDRLLRPHLRSQRAPKRAPTAPSNSLSKRALKLTLNVSPRHPFGLPHSMPQHQAVPLTCFALKSVPNVSPTRPHCVLKVSLKFTLNTPSNVPPTRPHKIEISTCFSLFCFTFLMRAQPPSAHPTRVRCPSWLPC